MKELLHNRTFKIGLLLIIVLFVVIVLFLQYQTAHKINKVINIAKECLIENTDGVRADEMFYLNTISDDNAPIYSVTYCAYIGTNGFWQGVVRINTKTYEIIESWTDPISYTALSRENIVQFWLLSDGGSNANTSYTTIDRNKSIMK